MTSLNQNPFGTCEKDANLLIHPRRGRFFAPRYAYWVIFTWAEAAFEYSFTHDHTKAVYPEAVVVKN